MEPSWTEIIFLIINKILKDIFLSII
jgi:hypothetical protein